VSTTQVRAAYIAENLWWPRTAGVRASCSHPSDALRLSAHRGFVLAEGGLYVDADDVLLGDGMEARLSGRKAKGFSHLCYDLSAVGDGWPAEDILAAVTLPDPSAAVFYVNNTDPIVRSPRSANPVFLLRRSVSRLRRQSCSTTTEILKFNPQPVLAILTAALAAHSARTFRAGRVSARISIVCCAIWDSIVRKYALGPVLSWATRANWRNVYGC